MKKQNQESTKKLTVNQLRKLILLEYARSIPDFATSSAASKCADDMKRYLVAYVQEKSADPTTQRQLLKKANFHLDQMESEIKTVIEKHMMSFIYNA